MDNSARILTWLVALFVGTLALAVPAGYSFITYTYMVGNLESEAEVIAATVTQTIISRNPEYWEFEKVRLENHFSRLLSSRVVENGRIFNVKNEIIAKKVDVLALPVISRSHDLTDAGVVVGRVEITRSLQPLMMQAGLIALIAISIGLGVFAVLWFLPIRSLDRAQNLVKQSEARYRSIFEYVNDIIFALDSDGAFSSVSPSLERMTGWLPDELIGKPFSSLVHPDEQPRIQELFTAALSGGPLPSFQMRTVTKAGGYIHSEVTAAAVRRGDSITIFGILRDITERKLAEEKIRKLNDELVRKEKLAVLGQVAGSVAHELRNPMGVMSNAVFFLQTVLTNADDSVKEYLNIIKNEIAGSERIVSDLLDAVRTQPAHLEIVGLRELLEQTLDKLSIPSTVTVKLDIPATLPPLRVDAMQIYQVLRNLISNGVEAMAAGGTLEIGASADASAGTITISVRDSGSGIAPEILPKLFQPLFTTKARGIGLGLLVVKNLTQANGGTVKVESEVGKGSVFHVTLPSANPIAETVL